MHQGISYRFFFFNRARFRRVRAYLVPFIWVLRLAHLAVGGNCIRTKWAPGLISCHSRTRVMGAASHFIAHGPGNFLVRALQFSSTASGARGPPLRRRPGWAREAQPDPRARQRRLLVAPGVAAALPSPTTATTGHFGFRAPGAPGAPGPPGGAPPHPPFLLGAPRGPGLRRPPPRRRRRRGSRGGAGRPPGPPGERARRKPVNGERLRASGTSVELEKKWSW